MSRRREDPPRRPSGDARRGFAQLAGRLPSYSLALTFLSAVLVAAPFLNPRLPWLHFVALAAWVVMLTSERARHGWLYFLLGIYGYFAMAYGPFSALSKIVPFWAAMTLTVFMLPFALIVRRVHFAFRTPLVLLVPVAWVTGEWVRTTFSAGQIWLYTLGSSQHRWTTLIQIADVTGVPGVSFVVAAGSGAVVDVWKRGGRCDFRRLWPLGAFAGLLVVVLAYGAVRTAGIHPTPGPRILAVQPNEVHLKDPRTARALLDRQLEMARPVIAPGQVDLIAFPENAIDYPYEDDPYFVEEVGRLAREKNAPVVIGAFSWASPKREKIHTSALYVSRDGELAARYDKIRLIPWAEYLPWEKTLARVSPFVWRQYVALVHHVMRSFAPQAPGAELTLLPVESEGRSYLFAAPICFEVSDPALGRRAVDAGADFLVNISSEGFFGAPLYHQMWALSVFRAVENRVGVVRVGNNGVTGFIDPRGLTQSVVRGRKYGLPYLDPGVVIDRVALTGRARTFYSRFGDLFAYLCVAASVGLFVASFFWRRRASASSAPGTSRRP